MTLLPDISFSRIVNMYSLAEAVADKSMAHMWKCHRSCKKLYVPFLFPALYPTEKCNCLVFKSLNVFSMFSTSDAM